MGRHIIGRVSELPPGERMYWHPHNYEVLSGELVMPGLPEQAETAALRGKVNSYGKTWHFWKTGVHGQQADPLPYGLEPNRRVLAGLARAAVDQHILDAAPDLDAMFAPGTRGLVG